MPVLETVGAVKRDAILLIVAKRLIGLLLGILIAKTKRDMRRQLITKGGCSAITLNVLRKNSAGIVSVFVE